MIRKTLLVLSVLICCGWAQAETTYQPLHPPPPPANPGHGSYFDWGMANDGFGYCFQFSSYNGQVLNGGHPVANFNCEAVNPSHVEWGRANNGWGYCFQFTPQHLAMNQGHPVADYQCEASQPSFYSWGRANDGWTYCFHYAPNGLVLNEGHPVANYLCGGR